jgi:hypothetical protein
MLIVQTDKRVLKLVAAVRLVALASGCASNGYSKFYNQTSFKKYGPSEDAKIYAFSEATRSVDYPREVLVHFLTAIGRETVKCVVPSLLSSCS